MRRRSLSPIERGVAVILAVVWLLAGAAGLYVALAHSRWTLAIVSVAALVYAAAWLRVAARSRLLTWRELIAPWRRVA